VQEKNFGYHGLMLIVHVQVQVKPECVEVFLAATRLNARASRLEPGVLRFDVLQQTDDPARFILIEHYRDAAAQLAHRETAHYPVWRDTVAPMMAAPRTSVKYGELFLENT
jgi:quinol monooxygenase YgiN